MGRIDAASAEEGKGSGSRVTGRLVVHPFARTCQVDAILAGLAPEFAELPRYSERLDGADDRTEKTVPRRLPPVALRRAVVRRCVWRNGWIAVLAVAAAGALIAMQATAGMHEGGMVARITHAGVLALAALCVLGTAVRAAGAVLWQKESRFTWQNTGVMLLNGGLSTDWTVILRQKVQSASARTNPFQRAAGVASVALATAAGSHVTVVGMWDWRRDQAEALIAWLRPGNKAHRPPA